MKSQIKILKIFIFTVLFALGIHVVFVLIMGLIFIGKYSPIRFLKHMFPALATAFSTDSSVATLRVTMDCLEKNVGISK